MRALAAVVGLLAGAGCSCQPELPPDPPDNNVDTDVADSADSAPVDTAPAPPCDAPEIEPNDDLNTATPLPMETVGCGEWSMAGDLDYFVFDLEEEAWITVWVDARILGSFADAHLVVQAEDGSAAARTDDDGTTDATLLFPATPQRYNVQLIEENNQGDVGHYFYEVVAAVSKAPVAWNRVEVEANDGSATAEPLVDGDVVFGDMKSNTDSDWFTVTIPSGKHTLHLEVEAFQHGSAGDFSIMLYDESLAPLPLGCNNCAFEGPLGAQGHDPVVEWDSSGDELLYFRIFEADGKSGDAVWYAMTVTMEAT